jgi:serine/threonine protein kinase
MAPDLFKKGEATSKIDAYSLGVTIYYMAFQKYPYTSKTKYMSLE